jgi:predicted RecA/RadA family phage recombinase
MAANEVYEDGDSLVLPVANTVVSGQAVIIGGLYGVALKDATAGSDGNYYTTVKFCGVFRLSIASALTVGQPIYITSAGALTTTATSNTLFGHAIKAKVGSSAGDAWIRIFGC